MANKIKNQSFVMKIVSIVLAIVLWVILTYTENPTITKTVSGIPVKIEGTEELEAKGLVLINTSKIDEASVKIQGPRSSVIKALSSITASIDVSTLNTVGKNSRYATFDMGVSDVWVDGRNNSLITVEVDELVDKDIPIRVLQKNEDINSDIFVESKPNSEHLTVRGAKSELEKVREAVVEADISSISEAVQGEYEYYFVDSDGRMSVFESMKNLPPKISVTHNIYDKKTVPIKIELEYDNDKYHIDIEEVPYDEISIGIPYDYEDKVDELVYTFSPANYEVGKKEYTVLATPPEGVFVHGNDRQISVKFELTPMWKSKVTVPLEIRNVENGMKAEAFKENIELTIMNSSDVNTGSNLRAFADASGLSEGEYELEVKTEGSDWVVIDDEYSRISVKIYKKG